MKHTKHEKSSIQREAFTVSQNMGWCSFEELNTYHIFLGNNMEIRGENSVIVSIQERLHLLIHLILSKSSTPRWLSVQIYEPKRVILI